MYWLTMNHSSKNSFDLQIINTNGIYFSFDSNIIDRILGSTTWGIPEKILNGSIFSCKENDVDIGDVIVWRRTKKRLQGTGHGRHTLSNHSFHKNNRYQFCFDTKRYMQIFLPYKNIDIIPKEYFNYFEDKRIIIVGNGPNGFSENVSNEYIDNHDIVVRVNSYKLIPNITGVKTDIHFMGSSDRLFHDEENVIYPLHSQGKFAMMSNHPKFKTSLDKIISDKNEILMSEIIYFDLSTVRQILQKIFNLKNICGMTGPYCFIIFYWISLFVKCEINYIGFGNHSLNKNNNQVYYWGERIINKSGLKIHNTHNFDMQYILLNLIDNM